MYGNGVVIGMENIRHLRRPIPRAPHPGLTACFAVVAGTAARGAAVCRIVAATARAAATTTAAAVWLSAHRYPVYPSRLS